MLVNEFFTALSAELALLRPRYEARRFDHAAIATYPTIRALLVETEPREEGKKRRVSPEGAAILCALVELHAGTRHRLWGALLLRAFRPMLRNLAKRLVGGSRDDRFALLLSSFHEALLRVDPRRDPLRIAMYVRQETRRGVFRELRKELAWQDIGFGVDADLCADPANVEMRLFEALPLRGRGRQPSAAHALLGTADERGGLRDFVLQHYGSLTAEDKLRVYRRLQSRRHRYLGRIRKRLRGELGPSRARAAEEVGS